MSRLRSSHTLFDSRYVHSFSFKHDSLEKNQTFTIHYADLFKSYCFGREFKKLIGTGKFVFADKHCIAPDQGGNVMLSEYGLLHMDECRIVLTKGYGCKSKYQGAHYCPELMRNYATADITWPDKECKTPPRSTEEYIKIL